MDLHYNAYEINQARIQYMLEGANRERLADIARAGSTKPSRIVRVLNAFQRAIQHFTAAEQQTSSVSEVTQPATNS